jgi:tRNA(Arg) A34 adenosine deaminase TadA
MLESLNLAKLGYDSNEVPVGAVIVSRSDRKIITSAHNRVEAEKNPLYHAEIVSINEACRLLNSKYLYGCDIYVSLEPCAMCAAAISYAKIDRLFYAASDPKCGGVEHGVRYFTSKACFYRPEIYVNLEGSTKDSSVLLRKFFSNTRKKSL